MGESRPLLLDLFCGAGGAATGYARAGFDIVGVDITPQPNYPFTSHQGDALEFVRAYGHQFDAIHASPPCQANCSLTKGTNQGRAYPQLVAATREALAATGRPSVIENVVSAPLRKDLVLCGEMFGLAVLRHRIFELGSWTTEQPRHLPHRGRVAGFRHGQWYEGPYFAVYGDGGGKGTVAQWQMAMGMDWTDVRREIAEAIPPAYTEYVGKALMRRCL